MGRSVFELGQSFCACRLIFCYLLIEQQFHPSLLQIGLETLCLLLVKVKINTRLLLAVHLVQNLNPTFSLTVLRSFGGL
jgi:hypothetical protein